MAAVKTVIFSFVVLVVAHQITANQLPGWQFPSFSSLGSGSFGGFQLPSIPGFGGSNGSSSGFLAFPFQLPGLPNLSGLIPTTTSASAADSSRKRREADDSDESSPDHQNRLFFSAFPTITSCNYTATPGASCPSCRQALRCLPNNVGILTTCRGFFRHCNNGRCSLFQSSACSSSSSGSSSSNSTSSNSTTT